MAFKIKSHLPVSVLQLLAGDAWKGGGLVQLPDTISTPKASQLVLNYCWLKPVVLQFRDRVPSAFFVADVFLWLDRMWVGKLLVPLNEGDTKETLAAEEAKKIKLLVSALRALWRSSQLVAVQSVFVCLRGLVVWLFLGVVVVTWTTMNIGNNPMSGHITIRTRWS